MKLVVLMLVSLGAIPVVLGGSKSCSNDGTYIIKLTTGNRDYAGTDEHISIKVLMAEGASDWNELDTAYNDFQKKSLDTFHLNLCDRGSIEGLMIKLDLRTGFYPCFPGDTTCEILKRTKPRWYMEKIKVSGPHNIDGDARQDFTCHFNEWVNQVHFVGCLAKNYNKWVNWYKKNVKTAKRGFRAFRVAGDEYLNEHNCAYWNKDGKKKCEVFNINNYRLCHNKYRKVPRTGHLIFCTEIDPQESSDTCKGIP